MKLLKCSLPEFRQKFSTKVQCEQYLISLKWPKGYQCNRCGHKQYKKGAMQMHRRCTACEYNESPTAHTVFHSIKIPLPIAFEMVYRIAVSKKGISALALSREYNLNPKTGYNFKRKIQQSMKSSLQNPLEGLVHVDEFEIGGREENAQGRKLHSNKKKAVIAIEIIAHKKKKQQIGRAYIKVIENYSSKELEQIFDTHISPKARIETDGWTGYKPLKSQYTIKQKLSKGGKNFPAIHTIIMNFKSWLRGIHHSTSGQHIQKYFDEYCFRFNRRNHIETLPEILLKRVQSNKHTPTPLTISGFYG